MKLLFTNKDCGRGLGRRINLRFNWGILCLRCLLDIHVEMLRGSLKLRDEGLAED